MDTFHLREYMICLFRALKDIHRRGIIHRDVKPANFLFDYAKAEGVLCDFGLAEVSEAVQSKIMPLILFVAISTPSQANMPTCTGDAGQSPRDSNQDWRYITRRAGSVRRTQEGKAGRRQDRLSARRQAIPDQDQQSRHARIQGARGPSEMSRSDCR